MVGSLAPSPCRNSKIEKHIIFAVFFLCMSKNEDTETVNLQKPSGTRDFTPGDVQPQIWLQNRIRQFFEQYGFEEVMLPTYDFFTLYEIRSGEKIINDIFTFYDPPKHREEEDPVLYALRPELTAPICRFFITSELSHYPQPLKLFYIANCFRYDEPSPGRYREFWQAGCELFGVDTVEADIEIMVMAMRFLESLELPHYTLRLNDLRILRTLLEENQLDEPSQNQIFGFIDKHSSSLRKIEIGAIDDQTEEEVIQEFRRDIGTLGLPESLAETLEFFLSLVGTATEVYKELKTILAPYPSALDSLKQSDLQEISHRFDLLGYTKYVIDIGIARGLDYYTSTVFEIDVPSLGKQKQICGGGRYNHLMEDFGGAETPATGFAYGFDRILLALEKENLLPSPRPKADLFIAVKNGLEAEGMLLAENLRKEGFRVETDLKSRSFKRCSKFVNAVKIPYVIFLGPREVESKRYTLKNFETREQETDLAYDDLVKQLRAKIE